jgi:hypothetical protein
LAQYDTFCVRRDPGLFHLMLVKGPDLFNGFIETSEKALIDPTTGGLDFSLCDFQSPLGELGRIKPVNVAHQGLVLVLSNICQDFLDNLKVLGLEGKVPVDDGIQPLLSRR